MSLYGIGDLHLSFGTDKPMDIFPGWGNYTDKIKKNWLERIKPEDTVVLAGDISWGMDLKEAKADFEFIHNLPGTKIILKGNHDYWFSTKKKVEDFIIDNGFYSIKILYNNSYEYDCVSICGTRGWINGPEEPANKKILLREAGRLRMSLDSAKKMPIVFLHYPPLCRGSRSEDIMDVLESYEVKRVFFGHLHGSSSHFAVEGECNGIDYRLISSDYIQFNPVKIM